MTRFDIIDIFFCMFTSCSGIGLNCGDKWINPARRHMIVSKRANNSLRNFRFTYLCIWIIPNFLLLKKFPNLNITEKKINLKQAHKAEGKHLTKKKFFPWTSSKTTTKMLSQIYCQTSKLGEGPKVWIVWTQIEFYLKLLPFIDLQSYVIIAERA